MKYMYRPFIVLCVFVLFFSGKNSSKNSSMNIIRGLKPAIAEFTSLEQKLIVKVAKRLENSGFPVSQLTRIHLKKRIINNYDYYAYNEITFFINPGVYKQGEFSWGIENIGVDWEDPAVIRTPDGGIEFEVGRKVKFEDLKMNLYRIQDAYSYGTLLKDHHIIIEKINEILLTSDLEKINYFTSQGLLELSKNYLMVLTADSENKNLYEMAIRRIDYNLIDFKHFNKLIEQYLLKINLNTSRIEILDSFDPTFFPTPVSGPIEPFPDRKD